MKRQWHTVWLQTTEDTDLSECKLQYNIGFIIQMLIPIEILCFYAVFVIIIGGFLALISL